MKHNKLNHCCRYLFLFCQTLLAGLICSSQIALAELDNPVTDEPKKDIIKDGQEELKARKFWDIGILHNIIIVKGKEYFYSFEGKGPMYVYAKPGNTVSIQCQYFMNTPLKSEVIPSDAEKWGSGLGFWIYVGLNGNEKGFIKEKEYFKVLPKFNYNEVKGWNPYGKKFSWKCGFNWQPTKEDIGVYRPACLVDSKHEIEETDETNNGYLELPSIVVYNVVPKNAYLVKIDSPKQFEILSLKKTYSFERSDIEVYWPPTQVDTIWERYDEEKKEWVDFRYASNIGYWEGLSPPNTAGYYRVLARSFYNGGFKGTTDWRYFSFGKAFNFNIDAVSKAPKNLR